MNPVTASGGRGIPLYRDELSPVKAPQPILNGRFRQPRFRRHRLQTDAEDGLACSAGLAPQPKVQRKSRRRAIMADEIAHQRVGDIGVQGEPHPNDYYSND